MSQDTLRKGIRRKVHVPDETKRDQAHIWSAQIYSKNYVRSLSEAKAIIGAKPIGCCVFFPHEHRYGMLFKKSSRHIVSYGIAPDRDYSVYLVYSRANCVTAYTHIDEFLRTLDCGKEDYDMIRNVEMQAASIHKARTGDQTRDSRQVTGQRGFSRGANQERAVHPRVREIRVSHGLPLRTPGACATKNGQVSGPGMNTGAFTRNTCVSGEPRVNQKPESPRFTNNGYGLNTRDVRERSAGSIPGINSEPSGRGCVTKVSDMLQSMRLSQLEKPSMSPNTVDPSGYPSEDDDYTETEHPDHDYVNVTRMRKTGRTYEYTILVQVCEANSSCQSVKHLELV